MDPGPTAPGIRADVDSCRPGSTWPGLDPQRLGLHVWQSLGLWGQDLDLWAWTCTLAVLELDP